MDSLHSLLTEEQLLQAIALLGALLALLLGAIFWVVAKYLAGLAGIRLDAAAREKVDWAARTAAGAIEEWCRRQLVDAPKTSEDKLEAAVAKVKRDAPAEAAKLGEQAIRDLVSAQVNQLRPSFAVSASIRPSMIAAADGTYSVPSFPAPSRLPSEPGTRYAEPDVETIPQTPSSKRGK
jgi:hypothetical protein